MYLLCIVPVSIIFQDRLRYNCTLHSWQGDRLNLKGFYFFFAPLTCTHSVFWSSSSPSFLLLLPFFSLRTLISTAQAHTHSEPISLAERADLYKRRRVKSLNPAVGHLLTCCSLHAAPFHSAIIGTWWNKK